MESTMTYQATIREAATIQVAALPHRGDYQKIGPTFERLAALASGQNLFGPSTRSFGIYYDDVSVVPREALRADACMTVPAGWTPGGQLELSRDSRRTLRRDTPRRSVCGARARLQVVVWDVARAERRGAGERAVRRGVSERRAHRSADRAQDRDLASLALRMACTSDSGTSLGPDCRPPLLQATRSSRRS